MNKIFKVIFNRNTQQLQVVSELASNQSKVSSSEAESASAVGFGKVLKLSLLTLAFSTVYTNSAYAAVAIGSTDGGTLVNTGATAATSISIAIGPNSTSNSAQAVAIGVNASATGGGALAFGASASSNGEGALAISTGAKATGDKAFAIGGQAEANASKAIAFGDLAQATANNAVAIGSQTKVSGSESTGIGTGTEVTGNFATGIGQRANASAHLATAIGSLSKASGSEAVAIGREALSEGIKTVAIGSNANAKGSQTIAFGDAANASDSHTVAISTDAEAQGNQAIAIGRSAKSLGASSVAIGHGANVATGNTNAVAVGVSSKAVNSATAIGRGANAGGTNAFAGGREAKASGTSAVAVGYNATALQTNAIAFGTDANATATSGVAIGQNANTANMHAVSLGTNATANLDRSVALGAYSTVSAAVQTPSYTFAGTTYNFAGGNPEAGDVVSVGSSDRKRQIQNVAAGQISNTSTDAINGSQLYSVITQSHWLLQSNGTKVGDVNFGDKVNFTSADKSVTITPTNEANGVSALDFKVNVDSTTITKGTNGELKANTTTLTDGNTDGRIDAPTNGNSLVTATTVADAINASGFKLTATKSEGEVEGTKDQLIKSGETVTIDAGKNIKLKQENGKITVATKDDVTFTNVTATTVTTGGTILNNNGLTVGGVTVTNKPITVNGTQVNNVNDAINQTATQAFKALSFGGDSGADVTRKLGEKVNVKGGVTDSTKLSSGNIGVVANGNDTLDIKLAKDLKDISSISINDGPSIDGNGINMNGDKITNVANGTEQNDAVNVSQLNAAKTVVEGTNGVTVTSEKVGENGKDGTKYIVKANTDGTTVKVENGNITAVTTPITQDAEGKATATTGTSLVTGGQVAQAINNAGLKFEGDKADAGAAKNNFARNNQDTAKVLGGATGELSDGNIGVVSNGVDTLTVKLAKDITIDSVKANNNVTIGGTTITPTTNGLNFATGSNNSVLTGVTSGLAQPTGNNLIDLNSNNVTPNTAATVGDLRNMGWVVSSDKTTTATEGQPDTNAFNNQVKNAGEVKFVGTGAAKVSGEDKNGTNVITVHVDPAEAPETAQISTNTTTGKAGTGADGSETAPNPTALATAGDVINAVNNSFWKVSEGTAANKKDDVKAGDNVVFANGTGTVATVENTDGVNTIVKYSVDKGDIQVDENTGAVSQPANEGDNKVATTGDVVDAISKSGFKLTAQGKDGSIVNPGETVDLNNTDGNIKITKSDKDNNVTFNLNNTVKLGDAATNPTGSQLTIDGDKGVISGLNTTLQAVPNNQNLASPTISDAQKTQAATLGDVLNAGWNLKENDTEKDFVKAYDTVNFVNGTGTTANVSMNNDGTVANVTFNVNNTTLSVNEDVTKADAGKVAAPSADDAKKFVTAGDLATAMNKTGFTLKTSATTDGEKDADSTDPELINAGDVVDVEAGKNIKVKQSKDGKITVSTRDSVTFTDVTSDTIKVPTGTGSNPITINKDGIDMANKPITNVNNGLTTYAAGTPTAGLVDLSKPTDGSAPKVADSTVATVGDLRNMGWVVSADKTTGDLGNAYNDQVKNANEVKFVGTNLATVSGKTENGVRTITVDVNAQNTVNSAQLPVVYTTADGTRVVKANDGKFYPADEVEADGTPKATAAAKEVAPKDVIASMNSGSDKTNEPTTLANVKSHLPSVNDTAKTVTPVGGVAAPAEINKAPLTAQQAAELAQNSANNAATLGDVLNAGWNLQANGSAVDFVRPFDTINFKDGANTKVVAVSDDGVTSELAVNVVGLPVSYTTQDGVPVAKVGDTFYEMKEDGTPDLTKPIADPSTLVANAINPTAKPNEKGAPITLGNIKSGVGSLDGSNRGDDAAAPTAIDASSPLGTALKDAYNGLADLVNAPQNNAVTAADLRNLGWVVSATGNDYADDVRHANEVRFIGNGLAKVEGKTTADGVREITVSVETGSVVPTQAVDNAGNPVTKVGDKYYKTTDIDPATGKPKAGVTEVAKADVTETPNSGAGLVTGNQVADAIQTSGFVIGKQTDTLAAADFKNEDERVNPDDNVRFADGNNTNVKLATKETTDASGKKVTTTTVKVDVTGLPISYTDENGTPVVKVGDKFFTVDAEGNPTTTEVPKDKLSTNLVNATAAPNEKGEPTKLGNVADGAVNETSNDAVNGSQLYAVGNATANMLGGNTTVNPTTGAPEGFSKDLNTTGGTATTADYKPTNPATNVADAIDNLNTYVNAGWKVGDTNGDVVERIAPNDQVNFVDSNTISAKVEANSQGGANVSFEVKTGALGGNNGGTTGSGGFVTAGQVADAINKSGFNLKTSAAAGGDKVSGSDELINPTDNVEMIAGKNLTVKQEDGGKVTFATAENVTFTTVNSTTVVVGDPTDPNKSTTLTSGNDGLNVGGDKITGVAAGDITPTSTNAINGSQLNNYAKVNGNNVNTTPDGSINIVNGNGTTVTTNGAGNIAVNVNNTDLNVSDGSQTNADGSTAAKGALVVQDPNGTGANYVNATTLATAVNNSGFTLTAQGKDGSLVKPGANVDMKNTDGNIAISKSSSNNDVTYNLAKDIKVDSVTAGNTKVDNNGVTITNNENPNKTVSLTDKGLNNGGNRITNVAAGQDDTDAVNVGQLKGVANQINNKINRNNREARAGIAGANAAAGLPQVYLPGKSMLAASAGTFKGEGALAVGYSRASDNGKLILKLQGNTNTRGEVGGSVGVGYQW